MSTTITPTILANLHTSLESYRKKLDDLAQRYLFIEIEPSQVYLERGFMKHGSLDAFDAHLDQAETMINEWLYEAWPKDLAALLSSKMAVLEYRISAFPNVLRAFEEEHGEFDDALFTLWYQR